MGSLLHGFFGFMRVSEFTIPAKDSYDKASYLPS